MKERKLSRNELLIHELEKMASLPDSSFELFDYKKCKVHPDCHIRHKKNYYSVPYRFVGKEVEVKFNDKMVHIYSETNHIGIHSIAVGQGHYISNQAHYPEDRVIDINYHLNSVRQKAKKIGSNTELLVKRLLEVPRQHPMRNLPKIQGILALKEKFSVEALECRVAEDMKSSLGYRDFMNLLLEDEHLYRANRRSESLRKKAAFKDKVLLAHFDADPKRGVSKLMIKELQTLSFLRSFENIIFIGGTGVGNSFLAQAIGHASCLSGNETRFIQVNYLFEQFKAAEKAGQVLVFFKKVISS